MENISKSQVDKAGGILRDENSSGHQLLYAANILIKWREIYSYPINTFQATLRQRIKNIDTNALVAQRLKRAPSILSKLKRFPTMKLSRMQDIGGLRAVLGSLSNVRILEKAYRTGRFEHKLVGERDYIDKPKDTGYRGLHLVYRYQNKQSPSECNGLLVELQIRTRLQHVWATAVETLGTYIDHALKSSQGPEEWLKFFALVGSAFAIKERCNPVPGYEALEEETIFARVVSEATRLDVAGKLNAFRIATDKITQENKQGHYHLVKLDLEKRTVSVISFGKARLADANRAYADYEEKIRDGANLQVVLVSTQTIGQLRRAYPNYFLDTEEFNKELNWIRRKATATRV